MRMISVVTLRASKLLDLSLGTRYHLRRGPKEPHLCHVV